ncbi:hypothetical protein ACSBR2_030278 [Camellia fascicularis]
MFSLTKTQPFNTQPLHSLRYSSFSYNPSNSAPFANHAALGSSNPAVVIDTLPTLLSQVPTPLSSSRTEVINLWVFDIIKDFPSAALQPCSSSSSIPSLPKLLLSRCVCNFLRLSMNFCLH